MSDVRHEDALGDGGGRLDTPTGWELLRRIGGLETIVKDNHAAVLGAIAGAYGKEYLDSQHAEFRRRLVVLEQHNLSQAQAASSFRTSMFVAAGASALAFLGNLTLFLAR